MLFVRVYCYAMDLLHQQPTTLLLLDDPTQGLVLVSFQVKTYDVTNRSQFRETAKWGIQFMEQISGLTIGRAGDIQQREGGAIISFRGKKKFGEERNVDTTPLTYGSNA